MLIPGADIEPLLQVLIQGRPTPMMVNTEASPNYHSHLPLSGKFVKTVGFSGQTQPIPTTAPVKLSVEGDSQIAHQIDST